MWLHIHNTTNVFFYNKIHKAEIILGSSYQEIYTDNCSLNPQDPIQIQAMCSFLFLFQWKVLSYVVFPFLSFSVKNHYVVSYLD